MLFFAYANNLRGLDDTTLHYLHQLKHQLKTQGYQARLIVISAKRAQWHNHLLTAFGAAKNSQHLSGKAIDIVVLDVNDDGQAGHEDVDIVVAQLEKLIGTKGGIGTYKSEKYFWDRQMVHFDSRGYKARWHR